MNDFNDEHAGKGGSYVIDAGGKRVLQERTDHVALADQQAAAAVAKTTTQPKLKGASNA